MNYNNSNNNKLQSPNDVALADFLKKQLDEKKEIISSLTKELHSLEIQVKNSDESEARLNKRIVELTKKVKENDFH